MYLIRLILSIAAVLVLASASPPSSTFSSVPGASETPIIISETSMCTNKTYIYCSRHDLTGDYTTDLADAVRGMDHFCPLHMIDPYKYYRTMAGRSQIYVCNYGDSLFGCSSGEYWAANALLDDKCGRGRGGWMYRETEERTWSVGRDPTVSDHEFLSECGMW